MADLTPQQAAELQALAANVEQAYREITRMRTALSYLVNAGRATCSDVRTYNLFAKSTYFYQKSMSDLIRGAGGSAPVVQEPLYVAWKGMSGEAAINIECGQVQGPGGFGEAYVDASKVEWRAGATPNDTQAIQQFLTGAGVATPPVNGQLGLTPIGVIGIIIVGVFVTIAGYIALKLVEAFTGLPQRIEHTRQTAIAAERHKATLEARAKCLADCTAAGKDPAACAKGCDKALPGFRMPAFSGMGIFGWVLGAVVVGGLVWLGYRAFTGQKLLPGMDGADDDELGNDAIDVDFMERVA